MPRAVVGSGEESEMGSLEGLAVVWVANEGSVGETVGLFDGKCVGTRVGVAEGNNVGLGLGRRDGIRVGFVDGEEVGEKDGVSVGICVKTQTLVAVLQVSIVLPFPSSHSISSSQSMAG